MLEKSGISNKSRVLEVGCGNGNTAIWLAQKAGCQVTGIDLSNIRIENSRQTAEKYPDLPVSFQKASATQLPFPEKSFTHIWSQATLFHIPQRQQAIIEIYRVLEPNGTLIFDDLVTLVI